MTRHARGRAGWRRALTVVMAGVAFAAGTLPCSAPVLADPASSSTDAAAQPPMTADQALAEVAKTYDTGTGGGQISNLVHKITRLQAKGFKPSIANGNALVAALDRRPNQAPLIEALQATLAFQQASQSRAAATKPQQPVNVGVGPAGGGGAYLGAPGGAIGGPVG